MKKLTTIISILLLTLGATAQSDIAFPLGEKITFKNNCLQEGENLMEFIVPKKNETILLAKDFNETTQELIFKLAHRDPERTVYWYLDSEYIGSTETFHEISVLIKPGAYLLTATDAQGNEVKQLIKVALASN